MGSAERSSRIKNWKACNLYSKADATQSSWVHRTLTKQKECWSIFAIIFFHICHRILESGNGVISGENHLNFGIIFAFPGLCPADRELVGDKVVGAYLTLCPEYSFVCESSVDGSIVAFAVSAPDAKKLFTR